MEYLFIQQVMTTAFLLRGYAQPFIQAKTKTLTEIYAAGEEPIVAADGRALARAVRVACKRTRRVKLLLRCSRAR